MPPVSRNFTICRWCFYDCTGGHGISATAAGCFFGWQTLFETGLFILALLALPIFLVGLLRGLPRWTYPAGGLVWGNILCASQTQGLFVFWMMTLLASFALILAAVYTHLYSEPLPSFFQRVGRSLALDWTRVSFGFYGVLPYAIISAFDDTYHNSRTACFALALFIMSLGAVAYCRSRHQEHQFGLLVGGTSGALLMAALEQIFVQGHSLAGTIWLSTLWVGTILRGCPAANRR